MGSVPMAFPKEASVVLTWIASEVTAMVSVTAPTSSVTATVAGVFTKSCRFPTVFTEKPGAFTVSEYLPGATWAKLKSPVPSATVDRFSPVSTLVSSTAAPEMAAPLGSVTRPSMDVKDWENAMAAAARNMRTRIAACIGSLLLEFRDGGRSRRRVFYGDPLRSRLSSNSAELHNDGTKSTSLSIVFCYRGHETR